MCSHSLALAPADTLLFDAAFECHGKFYFSVCNTCPRLMHPASVVSDCQQPSVHLSALQLSAGPSMSRPLSAPDFQQLSPSALRYSADWFLESQEGRWAASMHAALCSECLRWTTLLLASSLFSSPDANQSLTAS